MNHLNRSKITSIALLAILGAAMAHANEGGISAPASVAPVVGYVTDARGQVTLFEDRQVSNIRSGATFANGAKIIVPSHGRATLALSGGCSIPLQGGQQITIDTSMDCTSQTARVTQFFKPYEVASTGSIPKPPMQLAQAGATGVGGAAGAAGGLSAAGAVGNTAAAAGVTAPGVGAIGVGAAGVTAAGVGTVGVGAAGALTPLLISAGLSVIGFTAANVQPDKPVSGS